MMVPPQTLMVPSYVLLHHLGCVNTVAGLVIPHLAWGFGIFMLRQFFLGVPRESADAAALDGCGHVRTLWHVYLPLSATALVALAVIAFVAAWNDYWPLMVITADEMRTLPIGIPRGPRAPTSTCSGRPRWPRPRWARCPSSRSTSSRSAGSSTGSVAAGSRDEPAHKETSMIDRRRFLQGGAAALAFAAARPARAQGKAVEIEFLHIHGGVQQQTVQKQIENFNQMQSRVRVKELFVQGSYEGAVEKLQAMNAAGQAPAVAQGGFVYHKF